MFIDFDSPKFFCFKEAVEDKICYKHVVIGDSWWAPQKSSQTQISLVHEVEVDIWFEDSFAVLPFSWEEELLIFLPIALVQSFLQPINFSFDFRFGMSAGDGDGYETNKQQDRNHFFKF